MFQLRCSDPNKTFKFTLSQAPRKKENRLQGDHLGFIEEADVDPETSIDCNFIALAVAS
jgi:hypothetical protein